MKGVLFALSICLPGASFAQKTKAPTPKPKAQNEVRGTHQMAGAYVKFGETYSLKNGINLQILGAHYTMDPFPEYTERYSTIDSKLVVLDIAIKNWTKETVDFGNGESLVTLIDSEGQKYSGSGQLLSKGVQECYVMLKPSEGLGQPSLHNPFRMVFPVPLKAEITKIMINQPRAGKNEQVLRYCMAGTDKEADPANRIAPLPAPVRDPGSKVGAWAMPQGEAKVGVPMPVGPYTYTVEKTETVAGPLGDRFTGAKYLVATVKIANADLRKQSYFDAIAHESYAKSDDGDKFALAGIAKASSFDEPSVDSIEPGESIRVRFVFELGAGAAPNSVVFLGKFYTWKLGL